MFELKEIKEIRKKYKLNENGEIELTGREQAEDVSKMTAEEKSYIQSALFLYRVVVTDRMGFLDMTDEEFLKEIQEQFEKEMLSIKEYRIGLHLKGPSYQIWKAIFAEQAGAMTYFQRVAAQNEKSIQLLQRNVYKGLQKGIKFKLGKLFIQRLDPNNSAYTKNPEPQVLTLGQKQKRRDFVTSLMQVYKQLETDESYEDRVKNEEHNMRLIADLKVLSGEIRVLRQRPSSIPVVMNLLYAAQNLSLKNETDYIEILVDQPKVNEFLLNLKKYESIEKWKQKIQNRQNKGELSEHKPTHWENSRRMANELIGNNPNAVEEARSLLNSGTKLFTVKKGDTEGLRKIRLIEIVEMTQGQRHMVRTTDADGNRILQIESNNKSAR